MDAASGRPLFVYGSLRPGQLAHHQIAPFVDRSEYAYADGYGIWVRDGLPFIEPAPNETVRGDLLWATPDSADKLHEQARAYESDELYDEKPLNVRIADGSNVQARAFMGKRTGRGNPEAMVHGEWSAQAEPLFIWGLDTITGIARQILAPIEGHPRRVNAPAESSEFWDAYIPLEGLYLALCSVLERYTTLAYGAGKDPMKRLSLLGCDPDAAEAVRLAHPPAIAAVDSRKAASPKTTAHHAPFAAWYLVRNNLSHRGKGAIHDYQLLADALVGLHDALRFLLDLKLTPESMQRFAPADKLLRSLR